MYDILIKNGTIFDGSGNDPLTSSLGIKNGKISKIGNDISDKEAREIVDATGKYITPGFINLNNDGFDPHDQGLVNRGITTTVFGNYGTSQAPIIKNQSNQNISWNYLDEYLNYLTQQKLAVNTNTLVGWKTIRENTVGSVFRPLTEKEMESCLYLLKESLNQGGLGVSFGLSYPEQKVIGLKEMIEASKLVKKYNKLVTIQLRNEFENILESIDEIIELAKQSQAKILIINLKCLSQENWSLFPKALNLIKEANENFHTNIYFDINPQELVTLPLHLLLPDWLSIGDEYALRRNLEDKTIHKNILKILKEKRGLYENLVFCLPSYDYMFDGKTLKEVSKKFGLNIEETLIKILFLKSKELLVQGNLVSQDNILLALKSPYSITSIPQIHLSIPDAIYKSTGLPAKILNLTNKGLIKLNYDADLVIWDQKQIQSTIINGKISFNKNINLNLNHGSILSN